MPTVTLSEAAFAELKMLAEPFVDTPESLIAALVHAEVERRGITREENGHHRAPQVNVIALNPDTHESLAFTKLLAASIDGRELHRPKWNSVMNSLHVLAVKQLGSFDALKSASGAHLKKGVFEQDGFKYIPEGDISIQGVDANLAWDHSLRLARKLMIPIKAEFEWRDRDGAAHPGKKGVLEWVPATK